MTNPTTIRPSPSDASTIPPAPRALTAEVRQWIGREPSVRSWRMIGVVLLLAMFWIGVSQLMKWQKERQLVHEGEVVMAIVEEAAGMTSRSRRAPPDSAVRLSFQHNGEPVEVRGTLHGRKEYIPIGTPVEIRVDPADPQRWTHRTEAPSPWRELIGAGLLGGMSLTALGIAGLRRRRWHRVWRDGEVMEGVIESTHPSSLSPGMRRALCAVAGGNDRRLVSVMVRQDQAVPGATLPLVRDTRQGRLALAWPGRAPRGQ